MFATLKPEVEGILPHQLALAFHSISSAGGLMVESQSSREIRNCASTVRIDISSAAQRYTACSVFTPNVVTKYAHFMYSMVMSPESDSSRHFLQSKQALKAGMRRLDSPHLVYTSNCSLKLFSSSFRRFNCWRNSLILPFSCFFLSFNAASFLRDFSALAMA